MPSAAASFSRSARRSLRNSCSSWKGSTAIFSRSFCAGRVGLGGAHARVADGGGAVAGAVVGQGVGRTQEPSMMQQGTRAIRFL
ncbi:MAG: hypothetical protein DYH12_35360, partial [Sorangiineae bacterium PRO1]|nr:hypothetical protein [Sorangiineae bacterium PRO1]